MLGMLIAASATTQAVASAAIAAVVSLVVAVFTQLNLTARDRLARQYERRRTALLDVQDAALAFRQRLHEYGDRLRANPQPPAESVAKSERRFDDARGKLEVTLSRVDDSSVRRAVLQWREDAEVSFISAQDVPAAQELARWQAVNSLVGEVLQSRTGGTSND